MPTMIAPTPSDAPVGQQKKGAADQMASIPFARSSKWHIEQGNVTSGIVINTAVPGTLNFALPSYGYLSAVVISVLATGGTGTAAVYYEDAPFSILQNVLLTDVNGVPIWGPLSGYHTFLASKYGGYRLFGPDGSTTVFGNSTSPTFSQPTALGNNPVNFKGTSGNFGAVLPIYLEFGRDGLGALPNMDASARYNLQLTIASATANANTGPVYTTAPTGYPTLSVAVEVWCRSQPPAADLYGNQNSISPPAVGTVQYWSQQTFSSLSGFQTLQLSRVGNLVRNHIMVFRDPGSAPTRAIAETTDMPPTVEFDWDVGIRYLSYVSTIRQWTYQASGLDVPTGVVWYPNTLDPDKLAFSEFGDEWMQTVGATKLGLKFQPAASVNLTVLTNDMVPASGAVYAAPVLQGGY